jgi:hypothetical protein
MTTTNKETMEGSHGGAPVECVGCSNRACASCGLWLTCGGHVCVSLVVGASHPRFLCGVRSRARVGACGLTGGSQPAPPCAAASRPHDLWPVVPARSPALLRLDLTTSGSCSCLNLLRRWRITQSSPHRDFETHHCSQEAGLVESGYELDAATGVSARADGNYECKGRPLGRPHGRPSALKGFEDDDDDSTAKLNRRSGFDDDDLLYRPKVIVLLHDINHLVKKWHVIVVHSLTQTR